MYTVHVGPPLPYSSVLVSKGSKGTHSHLPESREPSSWCCGVLLFIKVGAAA